ncbi:MAG: chemotaxis protein CheW, partial [Erythrobacter sp.]
GSTAKLLATSSGDYYPVLDTSRAVFGAAADYERNLVVFADLGEAGRLALRASAIHGITRGRVRPLPFDAGDQKVAGVLNNSGDLVMVLDIEEMLAS